MKKQFLGLLAAVTIVFTSCSISERIVFNESMGGQLETSIDMTALMTMANEMRPQEEGKEYKKMDTIMKFDEMLETYKDSISELSSTEQDRLESLRGMTMRMQMDEENGVFVMKIGKDFKDFEELKFVSGDLNRIFDVAKDQQGQDANQQANPMNDMLKIDPVTYTFENNVFRRVDPRVLMEEGIEGAAEILKDAGETEGEEAADPMMDQMMGQFGEVMEQTTMTLEYVFPRAVKSVSHKEATISADKKTVTFVMDMQTLEKNKEMLDNFEVVLEDK